MQLAWCAWGSDPSSSSVLGFPALPRFGVLVAVASNPAVISQITSRTPHLFFPSSSLRSAWMNDVVYFYPPLRLEGNCSCYTGMNLRPVMSCYWVNPL